MGVTTVCHLMHFSFEVSEKLMGSLSCCMEMNQPCEPPEVESLGRSTWKQ